MHRNSWIAVVGVAVLALVAGSEAYHCQTGGQYKTYDPENCDKYYECNKGNAVSHSCGWFQRFDEKSNTCRGHLWLFGSVDCSRVNPTIESSTTHPSGSPTDSTTESSSSVPDNGATTTKKPSAAPVNRLSIYFGLFLLSSLLML